MLTLEKYLNVYKKLTPNDFLLNCSYPFCLAVTWRIRDFNSLQKASFISLSFVWVFSVCSVKKSHKNVYISKNVLIDDQVATIPEKSRQIKSFIVFQKSSKSNIKIEFFQTIFLQIWLNKHQVLQNIYYLRYKKFFKNFSYSERLIFSNIFLFLFFF